MEQVNTTYRPGNVSYEKNKITVETETSSTSVLFEDISSLSFRKQSYFQGNKTIVITGMLIFLLSLVSCFGTFDKDNPDAGSKMGYFILLSVGGLIVFFWGFLTNKITFENVIIETRGGSNVYFSVDEFEGEYVISSIEDKRREYQVSLSKKEKSTKKEVEIEKETEKDIPSNDIL
jgi:hypothetical protein